MAGGGGGGGGRGQSDIIIHTYARVQIIEFHNFLGGGGGGVRKMNIFWGYDAFVDIFWGHHKIGLYLGVMSMHFRVFS